MWPPANTHLWQKCTRALLIRLVYQQNFLILNASLSTSKELNGQSIIPPTIGMNSLAATADNILGNSSNDLLKIKIRHCYTLCILNKWLDSCVISLIFTLVGGCQNNDKCMCIHEYVCSAKWLSQPLTKSCMNTGLIFSTSRNGLNPWVSVVHILWSSRWG